MSLKDTIRQWGIEIEYPILLGETTGYDDYPENESYDKYNFGDLFDEDGHCTDEDALATAFEETLKDSYGRKPSSFTVHYDRYYVYSDDILWDIDSDLPYFNSDDQLECALPGEPAGTTRAYNCHIDGRSIEFAPPKPLPLDDIKKEVYHIYSMCDKLKARFKQATIDDSLFDSDRQGIHIRLDITDWDKVSILRAGRFFSHDMDDYGDFVSWVAKNFRRGWDNYNHPVNYASEYRPCVEEHDESDKFRNIHYEYFKFDDAITLEIRGFAVPENPDDVIPMFDFICTMCDIIDLSKTISEGKTVPERLYDAWNQLVNGIAPTEVIV